MRRRPRQSDLRRHARLGVESEDAIMVVDPVVRDALEDLELELRLLELFQQASLVFVIFDLLRLEFPEVRRGVEDDDRGYPVAAHRAKDEPPERITPTVVRDLGDDAAHDHVDYNLYFERHGGGCQLSGPRDSPG